MTCCLSGDGTGCIDDEGVLQRIRDIRRENVETAVVEVVHESGSIPILVAAWEALLEAAATEGGFPNRTGPHRYFSGALSSSLDAVFSSAEATCQFSVPANVTLVSGTPVWMDGNAIRWDATHSAGWDWIDAATGTFQFFGAACEAYQEARPLPRVTVMGSTPRCEL